jgi:hypothetical protein
LAAFLLALILILGTILVVVLILGAVLIVILIAVLVTILILVIHVGYPPKYCLRKAPRIV